MHVDPQKRRILKQTLVQSGGPEKVVQLLHALEKEHAGMANELLDGLQKRNPILGNEVRKKMVQFDDLGTMHTQDLQRIVREQEKRDLLLSLRLARSETKSAIFQSLSKRAAEDLQQELAEMEPVPIREVEAAQQRILDSVQRLKLAGEIE